MAMLEGLMSWSKAFVHNMGKIMGSVTNSLCRVAKLRNLIVV